jgi:hypothetical protein
VLASVIPICYGLKYSWDSWEDHGYLWVHPQTLDPEENVRTTKRYEGGYPIVLCHKTQQKVPHITHRFWCNSQHSRGRSEGIVSQNDQEVYRYVRCIGSVVVVVSKHRFMGPLALPSHRCIDHFSLQDYSWAWAIPCLISVPTYHPIC